MLRIGVVGAFLVWATFFSGVLGYWVDGVPPGVVQAVRLRKLLFEKENQIQLLEKQIAQLELDRKDLEGNRRVQEREVRRVLGYVAEDELVFEF